MFVFQQKVLRDAKRQEKVHVEETKEILELDSDTTDLLEFSQGIKKNRTENPKSVEQFLKVQCMHNYNTRWKRREKSRRII